MSAATENFEEVKANLIIKLKLQTKFCCICRYFLRNYHKQVQQSSHSLFCGQAIVICVSRCPDLTSPEVSLHSFSYSYKSQECFKICLANLHILNTSSFTKENAFLTFTLLIIKYRCWADRKTAKVLTVGPSGVGTLHKAASKDWGVLIWMHPSWMQPVATSHMIPHRTSHHGYEEFQDLQQTWKHKTMAPPSRRVESGQGCGQEKTVCAAQSTEVILQWWFAYGAYRYVRTNFHGLAAVPSFDSPRRSPAKRCHELDVTVWSKADWRICILYLTGAFRGFEGG